MIKLTELQKVLSQELRCFFVQQEYHSPNEINHTKTVDVSLLHFYCILTYSLNKAESFLRS